MISSSACGQRHQASQGLPPQTLWQLPAKQQGHQLWVARLDLHPSLVKGKNRQFHLRRPNHRPKPFHWPRRRIGQRLQLGMLRGHQTKTKKAFRESSRCWVESPSLHLLALRQPPLLHYPPLVLRILRLLFHHQRNDTSSRKIRDSEMNHDEHPCPRHHLRHH